MMTVSIELITPEIAKQYLALNTHNYRKLNPQTVSAYRTDMLNGNWQENGDSIRFYEDGTLFDGQTRLTAVVQSGVPIRTVVVRGVPMSVTLADVGQTRSIAQITATSNSVTGIGAFLYKMKSGHENYALPKGVIADFIHEHIELLSQAARIIAVGEPSIARKAPCGVVAYIHLLNNETTYEELEKFFRVVNNGIQLEGGRNCSSAQVLRNMIMTINKNRSYNANRYLLADATYQALQDFKTGKQRMRAYTETGIVKSIVMNIDY